MASTAPAPHLQAAARFGAIRIIACAGLDAETARARAAAHGIEALAVDEPRVLP